MLYKDAKATGDKKTSLVAKRERAPSLLEECRDKCQDHDEWMSRETS